MSHHSYPSKRTVDVKQTLVFFVIVTVSALCLSFITAIAIHHSGMSQHAHKYLLTSVSISACVALPIALIASHNQFRLLAHRDPLETLSQTDSLGGLLSRRFFLQAANQLVQRMGRTDQMSCLIVFDLDGFKRLNDRFGSNMGDKVLLAVSAMAREELRGRHDLITRWWGDQFVIALYNATPAQTQMVAERIRSRIADTEFDLEGETARITASFGYAPLTKYDRLEIALGRADEAMTLAKTSGQNCLRCWSMTKLAA